jgi:hypothetical protein
MKRLFDILLVAVIIAFIGALAMSGVWLIADRETITPVGIRNVEFIFRVTDADSGEPVSGARVNIRTDERDGSSKKLTLTADESGRARILREHVWLEEVRRPFHETVNLVDRTWCVSFTVTANAYRSLDEQPLFERNYEDLGIWVDGMRRIEFRIPLEKQ